MSRIIIDKIYISQGYGTDYATINVGLPNSKPKSVIFDTVPHITAFPCVVCVRYELNYHTSGGYYDPRKSETFEMTNCESCGLNKNCENLELGSVVTMMEASSEGRGGVGFMMCDEMKRLPAMEICGGLDAATNAEEY